MYICINIETMTTHKFHTGFEQLKVESLKMLKEPFIKALVKAGGTPFFVGGFVRDTLIGKVAKDIDIVVEGMDVTDIQNSIKDLGKLNLVGESFAVLKFTSAHSQIEFDIAAPRTERKLGDGHKGFEVSSSKDITIEQDLFRRDFTINSVAVNITNGMIFDPFDGVDDLEHSIITMTNPEAFIDDPLRILRAVQMAARFDFFIGFETLHLMKKHIVLIKEIAGERMHDELLKVFDKGGSTSTVIRLLTGINFFKVFELETKSQRIDDKEVKTPGEFFSTLLSHSKESPEVFMKLFKGEMRTKKQMLALQKEQELFEKMPVELLAAEMVKITKDSLDFGTVKVEVKQVFDKMKSGELPMFVTDLEISGDDLLSVGFKGKEIGDAMKELLELVLLKKLQNKKVELLDFVKTKLT